MLKTEDLAFFKETIPFWNKLLPQEQKLLEQALTVREFTAGEMIHRGEENCSGLLLIQSGQLRTYILSDTGKEITLYRLLEQDICLFTASCVLHNINFEVYVQAEKPGRLLQVPTPVFKKLMQSSLPVADYINQLMASRFSDVMWVMEQVLFMSFDKRLALFLLEQSSIENSDTLNITHETIAKHMGSAREVVTRMLKYFQNDGMVSLSRGGLTLTNRKKLEQLAREKK